MKIFLVGSNKSWAIERYYVQYLTEWGVELKQFAAPDIIFDRQTRNLVTKVLFRTGVDTGYNPLNRQLIEEAEAFQPDVIWVWKGMEILPSTLQTLGEKFMLANYNPDHPFIISSRGGGNKNVSNSVALYDLHFCYGKKLKQKIEREFHIPTVLLPFGYELSPENFEQAAGEPEINKACFIGNPDQIREEALLSMVKSGIPVDVYGHGWQKTQLGSNPGVGIYDAVYGDTFWKKLRQYRIQVNIFRPHNVDSHNMRSFEIPAVGGIQLAPYSEEQAEFFETGREIFFYRNEKEMLDQVNMLTTMSEEQTDKIRAQARKRSLDSGYSYKDRAKTVLETFQAMGPHA